MEWDADDDTALHAVAINRLGMPLATGRLLPAVAGMARIGRMAVIRVLRGSGLGREILLALMKASAERGDPQIMLHAQRSAEGFYKRLGFTPQGEPFDEAGIAHIEMRAVIPPQAV
jgi:predicted GNAT family N-acyltransferase